MPTSASAAHQAVIATSKEAKPVLLQSAIEGHVLVKNTNKALPLKSPKLISVFGYDAYTPMTMDLSTSFDFSATATRSALYQNGTQYVGGGSGANSPAYVDAPISAIQRRAYEDGSSVLWDFTSESPSVDYTSDVCLVFINSYATEGYDRAGLDDTHSDTIVNNVADNCANTIVVIHNAGIRIVESWVDHTNVTGIIYAHLPGQDTGRALVEILYGDSNPSGRLPTPLPRRNPTTALCLSRPSPRVFTSTSLNRISPRVSTLTIAPSTRRVSSPSTPSDLVFHTPHLTIPSLKCQRNLLHFPSTRPRRRSSRVEILVSSIRW